MAGSFRRRVAHVTLAALSATLLALVAPTPAGAIPSPDIVISQVYGGGGNSGATYTHDFVELYNRGASAVVIDGWSVQYTSATGTGSFGASSSQLTELSGTIQPGHYWLVQEATQAAVGVALPTPDVSDATPISMSASGGKVALVTDSLTLGCNGSSTPCSAPQLGRVRDLVGYGNANFFEGIGPAPTPSATVSVLRTGGVDTDDNVFDFAAGPVTPRNSAFVEEPPEECTGAATEIAAIQGSGTSTPIPGASVTTEGIVTGDFNGAGGLGGFYIQDDTPDADTATSEGIFVASSSAVSVGDRMSVCGTTEEFFGQTQVTAEEVVIQTTGNAITPTIVVLPRPEGTTFEPVESMLVTFPEALTATEHFQLGRLGEITVSSEGRLFQPTDRVDPGAPAIALAADNARRRLLIDDGSNVQNPAAVPFVGPGGDTLRIGDTASGITGVLGFGFGLFRLQPTAPISFGSANPRPPAPADVGGDVQVASFNTLNYFTTLTSVNPNARGANSAEELTRQQAKEVAAITGLDADVVALMEVENNGSTAVGSLVDALNAATAPGTYAFIAEPELNAPNEFGGTFGTDAIKVALIYKPAVVTPNSPAQSSADAVFDRPPLIQTFTPVAVGESFTVAVNHFKSKNCGAGGPGDQDSGDGQSCFNARRVLQAQALASLLDTLDPPNTLILGDLNSYTEEDPIHTLGAAGYAGLSEAALELDDRYSFVFDGFSGELDHALASPTLLDNVTGTTIWHIDADEPLLLDYNLDFGRDPNLFEPNAYRASDHDPLLVGLQLGPEQSAAIANRCARGGVAIALINIGDESADFVVAGGAPMTVAGPDVVKVTVPVAEGGAFSIFVTVDGIPVPGSPVAGTRNCQKPVLSLADACAKSGGVRGVEVAVTNSGKEAAVVTVAGVTKVVPKNGGQKTFFVALANGVETNITAASPGNHIKPLKGVMRDCTP